MVEKAQVVLSDGVMSVLDAAARPFDSKLKEVGRETIQSFFEALGRSFGVFLCKKKIS